MGTTEFRFQRLFDYATISRIMLDPAIYDAMADDFSPPRAEFHARMDDEIKYLACFKGETLLGMWVFLPMSPIWWEVHTCMLPAARGQTIQATRAMLRWLWENSEKMNRGIPLERLRTYVPKYNRPAFVLARTVGMEVIGTDRQSIKKGGILHDQFVLGLSKPGVR